MSIYLVWKSSKVKLRIIRCICWQWGPTRALNYDWIHFVPSFLFLFSFLVSFFFFSLSILFFFSINTCLLNSLSFFFRILSHFDWYDDSLLRYGVCLSFYYACAHSHNSIVAVAADRVIRFNWVEEQNRWKKRKTNRSFLKRNKEDFFPQGNFRRSHDQHHVLLAPKNVKEIESCWSNLPYWNRCLYSSASFSDYTPMNIFVVYSCLKIMHFVWIKFAFK